MTVDPDQDNKNLLMIARGGSVVLVSTIATRGINFFYNIFLVWVLGAEGFGIFTLALAIVTFVSVITELGLDLGIVRYGAIFTQTHGEGSVHKLTLAALRISLTVGLFALIVLLASADLIATGLFHKPELTPIFRILAAGFPLMSAQALLLAATRAIKEMKYSASVWVVQPLAAILLVIPLTALGQGVEAAAWAFVASNLLGAGLSLYYYLKVIPRNVKDVKPIPVLQIVRFSIPLSLTKWIQFANERTEVFFLGMLPSAASVGIYKIAWSLAGLETILRLSLETILAPFSSDLSHRKEIKQLESLYKTTAKWGFAAALLLFFIYLLFARSIMNLFDPAYVAGVGVLVMLAFAQLFNEATGACGTLLIMSGRSDLSMLNTIVLFVVNVTLAWLLIPPFGLMGAAVGGSVTIILVNILRVVEVWLTLKIHPLKWSFLKPIIAGLLCAGAMFAWRTFVYSGPFVVDLIYMVIFALAYITIIYLLRLDSEDMVVLKAVGRKFSRIRAEAGKAA